MTSWTFSSVMPVVQLSYDVYVPSNTDLAIGDYLVDAVVGGSNTVESFATTNDATAPSLGGWSMLGTVTVPARTTSLIVSYGAGGTAPTAICLLQPTGTTTLR